jgi:hypothetical protein
MGGPKLPATGLFDLRPDVPHHVEGLLLRPDGGVLQPGAFVADEVDVSVTTDKDFA